MHEVRIYWLGTVAVMVAAHEHAASVLHFNSREYTDMGQHSA